MEFTHSLHYPVTIDVLIQTLTDPEFIAFRFEQLSASATTQLRTPDATGRQLVTTQALIPAMELPSAIRGFLPPEVKMTLVDAFTPQPDGSWNIESEVSFSSLPVSVNAQSRLVEKSGECERQVNGNVRVTIPFFGRKAEAAAIEHLDMLGSAELSAIEKWLSR